MQTLKQLIDQFCPDGVEYVRLGDVCSKIIAGGDPPKDILRDLTPSGDYKFPVYSNGKDGADLYGYAKDFRIGTSAVTIAARGSIGYHTVRDANFTPVVRLLTLIPNAELVSPSFLDLALSATPIEGDKGGIPQLTVPRVKNFHIPLPPREVQDKIVEYLDTFAALCENIDTEIAQREQQFAEYREKLLSPLPVDSALGEHGTFIKGKGIQKKDFIEDGKPAFHYGQVHTNYGFQAKKTTVFISDDLFSSCALAEPGDLIIATTSEDDEAVAKAVAWLGNEPAAVGGDAHFYRHEYDPRFISYFFTTYEFQRQKVALLTGGECQEVCV